MKTLSFEEFQERFKPQLNHLAQQRNPSCDPESCAEVNGLLYQDYGEDLEFILQQNPKHVWTVVFLEEKEGEFESQWNFTPGFRRVNKEGYIITENPWDENSPDCIW
jgi:hypothetical protein